VYVCEYKKGGAHCGLVRCRSSKPSAGTQTSFSTFFCGRLGGSGGGGGGGGGGPRRYDVFYARPHRRLRRPARHADNYFISVVITDRNNRIHYNKRVIVYDQRSVHAAYNNI